MWTVDSRFGQLPTLPLVFTLARLLLGGLAPILFAGAGTPRSGFRRQRFLIPRIRFESISGDLSFEVGHGEDPLPTADRFEDGVVMEGQSHVTGCVQHELFERSVEPW